MFLDLRKQKQWGLRQNEGNFSQNSYISYLPRQACYKAFIFFTAHTVRHDWRLVFLTLGNVHQSYFVRLATGERKNHTTVRLNNCFPSRSTSYSFLAATSSFIFPALFISCEYSPRFPPLTRFPALTKDHKFVPRLATVTNFPAFFTGYIFSAFTDDRMLSCAFYFIRFLL